MISFETAKALKDAGFEWGNQLGDKCYQENRERIFAPRLDQLLVEIEKRGYRYRLDSNPDDETNKFYTPTVELLVKDKKCKFRWWVAFADCADSPEEATAQALLWILWKEGSAMPDQAHVRWPTAGCITGN